ncbi:MAG: OmpA family protein, partial [Candidatus Kapaibacteriota bacterium]
MLKSLAFFGLLIIALSCSTLTLQLDYFNASPDEIEEGSTTTISWSVAGAESVSIDGIGENLNPVDSFVTQLYNSKTFVLVAKRGSETLRKTIYVRVNQKMQEKKQEVQKSIPILERKNTTISQYLKGLVNAENVAEKDNPMMLINLIDAKEYPKKVKLFITIKDKFGNHIANLAPPYNYAYLDNWKTLVEEIEGKDYQIKDFTVEEVRENAAPPFTTSFVLDYSGSMFDDYYFVEQALEKAVSFLRPNLDDYQVIQFDNMVYKPVGLTSDVNEISKLLPFDILGGATAFYDASIIGLDDISKSSKAKVAILFTDGADNSSLYGAFDVVLRAREVGAKVFVIGFNRPFGGFLTSILNGLAVQTGGKAYFPSNLDELDDIFAEIYQIMKVYYVVTYSAVKSDVNNRLVKLFLNFPNSNKVLSAEREYYVKPVPFGEEEGREIALAWFDNNKYTIKKQYMETIKRVAEILKANPNKKILIVGHTDSRGSDAYNNSLSLKRAQALAKVLINLGVKKQQIYKIEGRGKK